MAMRILEGPVLSGRTTLGLGGTALAEVAADVPEDLLMLPETLEKLGGEPLVLGRGSNILARDGELPLVIVNSAFRSGPEVVRGSAEGHDEASIIRVGSGVMLPRLLAWLREQGFGGMEGLAGIPGHVGGAVAMNAGSWGTEIADVLHRARVFLPGRGLVWVQAAECGFAYRHFSVRGHEGMFCVAEAEFALKPSESAEIGALMKGFMDRKKAGQPVTARSAGCVFRNPASGVSAGMLIDKAGLRGYRLGGMGFSEVHANFLVNHGGGTAGEALELLDLAMERVRESSGYELRPEVKVVP